MLKRLAPPLTPIFVFLASCRPRCTSAGLDPKRLTRTLVRRGSCGKGPHTPCAAVLPQAKGGRGAKDQRATHVSQPCDSVPTTAVSLCQLFVWRRFKGFVAPAALSQKTRCCISYQTPVNTCKLSARAALVQWPKVSHEPAAPSPHHPSPTSLHQADSNPLRVLACGGKTKTSLNKIWKLCALLPPSLLCLPHSHQRFNPLPLQKTVYSHTHQRTLQTCSAAL